MSEQHKPFESRPGSFQAERRRLKRFCVTSSIGAVIAGLGLWQLITIPFGWIFSLTLIVFSCLTVFALMGWGIHGMRSRRWWLKLLGLFPVVLSVAVAVLTIVLLTDPRVLYYRGPVPRMTDRDWVADMKSLADQLSGRHADLEALISRDELEAAVSDACERLPDMSEGDRLMEIFRITALPDDAHTFPFIVMPCFNLHALPIQIFGFSDGWGIVAAGREYRDLVGYRILEIQGRDMEDIYRSCPLLLAAESEMGRRQRFAYVCVLTEWLHYNRIISDIHTVELTLGTPDGRRVTRTLNPVLFYPYFLWSNYFRIDNDRPMVFSNPREDNYRYEWQDEGRTLFIQFNVCENQEGGETLDDMVDRMRSESTGRALERCILDIRHNDGGSEIWRSLLTFLREDSRINRPGHLLVLIGRRTFSSAVMFANQLQMQTNATFLGEPTAQGPVFFAGPRLIDLPQSGLPIFVSSHKTVAGLPFDKRNCIVPDLPVRYTLADFREGHDPVMERARSFEPASRQVDHPLIQDPEHYTGRYLMSPVQAMDVTVDDGTLQVAISDFVPGGFMRFNSRLLPVSAGRFHTRLKGFDIQFEPADATSSKRTVVQWEGRQIPFERAPDGYTIATELFEQGDIPRGVAAIRDHAARYVSTIDGLERILNGMGYDLMGRGNLSDALLVFQLNTELYPESFNAFDSYGEALLKSGDREGAIANYRRSLELYPKSPSGLRALEQLGVELDSTGNR